MTLAVVAAYSTFDISCTLPSQTVNYVSSGNARSTLDIVWSSCATILICTYTVLHPNVPEQRDGRDPGLGGDIKWSIKGFMQSLVWFAVTLIAPEFYTTIAVSDFLRARALHRKFRLALSDRDMTTWTMTHMYFINMGGFAIRVVPGRGSRRSGSFIWHLRGNQIFRLIDLGWLDPSAPVSEDEINDRAKNNTLAKGITVIQIFSCSVGVFTRAVERLPISLLELGALSFAAVSVVAWVLQFQKPKSVNTTRADLCIHGSHVSAR